jgi:plasmid replication initiation protein
MFLMIKLRYKTNKVETYITKSQTLIESQYDFSHIKHRWFSLALSRFNSLSKHFNSKIYLSCKDFSHFYGKSIKSAYRSGQYLSKNYSNLKKVKHYCWKKEKVITSRVIKRIEYKRGIVVFTLHKESKQFFWNLKKHFASYKFHHTLNFKSKYTYRLYEMALIYLKSSTNPKLRLCDLRKRLKIENKYKQKRFLYYRLRQYAREICEKTDINLEFSFSKDYLHRNFVEFLVGEKGKPLSKSRPKQIFKPKIKKNSKNIDKNYNFEMRDLKDIIKNSESLNLKPKKDSKPIIKDKFTKKDLKLMEEAYTKIPWNDKDPIWIKMHRRVRMRELIHEIRYFKEKFYSDGKNLSKTIKKLFGISGIEEFKSSSSSSLSNNDDSNVNFNITHIL